MSFEGIVEKWERDEFGEFTVFKGESPNLWVDDGKEACLDAMMPNVGNGRTEWWENYQRWIGYGSCMFNNESFERASGIDYIATGSECDYPVSGTFLVAPEDSFLSREIPTSQRVAVEMTRRDQTIEIAALINVPGDIPIGTEIREWGLFLKRTGPFKDPSYFDDQKSRAMLCRSVEKGTGYYESSGGSCSSCGTGASGAVLCYYDDPYIATGDIQLRWRFGEL